MSDIEKRELFVSTLIEWNNNLRGNLNLCVAARNQLESERRELTARVADLERQIRALNTQHDREVAALKQARAVRTKEDHEVVALRRRVAYLENEFLVEREELQAARRTIRELKARVAPLDEAARAEATAKRARDIWSLRKRGLTYRKIAEQMNISIERARQIATKAERQIAHSTEVYAGKVLNPVVYGVWHEFTHEGRVGLP